ncbi:MAG: hypothetical protein AB8G05_21810, partial [Oligoflexales bacterium]
AWAPPRSFDFPTIIAFLEKLGKFAKDYSALSLTYKGGGVFPIRHYVGEGGLGVRQREAKKANEPYFNPDFGGYATSQLHVQSLSITSTGSGPSKLTYEVFYDASFNHKIELISKDRKKLGKN